MATIKVSLGDLPSRYRSLGPRMAQAVQRGAVRGAARAVSTLQRATTAAGAVNTGLYRAGWKSEPLPNGVRVYNTQPYAGVIEGGRRAGSAFPPLEAIARWAQRKLGLTEKEARRAAYPIARAIARKGIRARKVLGNALPQLSKDLVDAIEKELDLSLAGRRP